MQPSLKRSTTETMVSGVCGGIAEYFSIDPVIVRLIFVVVTLTSGLGLPVYILLWIIMPKASTAQGQQSIDEGAKQFSSEVSQFGQQISHEALRLSREVLVGQRQDQAQARSNAPGVQFQSPQREHRFDPFTGQPLTPDNAATGQTVSLNLPATEHPHGAQPTSRRSRSWSMLGIVLIGIGGLVLLEQLGIDMSLIFPALMIMTGVILMRRKR